MPRHCTKYMELKSKFKKLRKKSDFVPDLKLSDPLKWHQMAKNIPSADTMVEEGISAESLEDITNDMCRFYCLALCRNMKPVQAY